MLPVTAAILGALIVSASCGKSEGEVIGANSPLPTGSGSAGAKAGSSGSFSTDLAHELGSAAAPPKPGSAGSAAAGTPADVPKLGSAAVPPPRQPPATEPARPSAAPATDRAGPQEIEMEPDPPPAPRPGGKKPRGPVRVASELAEIKLSLLPNWDRDVDEAGTFQYVVRIKGTQATKTFMFRYGYDDPRAPVDREQYKKFLHDTKILAGEIKDRQRGAAWFLEGIDATGLPAFRFVVLYGGKRLVCYGSAYKDADSNRLGDDRDQTVIQAKQICETLAL